MPRLRCGSIARVTGAMKLVSSTRCRKVPEAPQQLSSHRRSPPNGHGATMRVGGDRHPRTVQIGEALLLLLVTIAAAWSGYDAAVRGTESRIELEAVGAAGGEPRVSGRAD